MYLGVFSFSFFIFISFVLFKFSIGLILLAFIADLMADKYIVISPRIHDIIIPIIDM